MSSEPIQGLVSDVQELLAWRPLAHLLEKYRNATDTASRVTALVDCVMFVLDRVEPGGVVNLRLALTYAQAAVASNESARKLAELLISSAEGPRPFRSLP